MNTIEFNGVWKKFRKGERFDSLRDLIPSAVKNIFARKKPGENELEEKEFWALRDVSFQVKQGEILGIIGPNGSGKSTILKLLCGILKPTRGEIAIRGRLSALIEVGAGFHNDLTGRENIYLNGAILGMRKKEIDRQFDSIVAFSELEDFIDTPVKRYSSGMYVRLGFSVAAHLDPEILLIDEVLSVGDFRFQRKCMEKMNEFISKGTTVIFISHNLPSVIELCPQTILISKGRVQQIGDSRRVVHDYYRAHGNESRVQNSTLQLTKSVLRDAAGTETSSFKAGERASLTLSLRTASQLKGVALAIMIKRQDGVVVFDAHSELTAGKKYDLPGNADTEMTVAFRASLPEGIYYAGVYLQTDMKEVYFYEDELLQFYVKAPKISKNSYAFLEPEWK